MLKKALLALFCVVAVVMVVGCAGKKSENDEKNHTQKPEIKNEDIVKIDINVKPLEKVEKKTLSEAASSLGFENEKLFHAFANAIGKKPEEVTQEDVDKIHFIAVGPEKDFDYSLFVGYIDYVDLCFSEESKSPDFSQKLGEKVMMSELEYDIEKDSLSDLGNFKNMEMFEIYDVNIEDVSFIKNYNRLIYGFFRDNGITDLSPLKGYNPESLRELDFTGNEITDWAPVDAIKDKIVVFYDMESGIRISLESFLEQTKVSAETLPKVSEEAFGDEDNKKDEFKIVDEKGNPTDFGSLFD